jgi:hypothetical protein
MNILRKRVLVSRALIGNIPLDIMEIPNFDLYNESKNKQECFALCGLKIVFFDSRLIS